jgi:hypothetical protein
LYLVSSIPYLSPVPYRSLEPVSKQLTIVIGLTVVGFMAFGLALSYYRNVLFEGTLLSIGKQNTILGQQIERGYRDLEYFRSVQYKDKFAKENLGKVNPGEKVLIITPHSESTVPVDDTEGISEQREARYFEFLRQMPVPQQWLLYLFYPEKVEELKRGI